MQQSLFRGKAISLGSRCVWAILCLQEEVHSICHIWGHFVTLFCHVRRHEKIVTFEDLSDLHRLHLCACPICSRSDFQRVRFSAAVVRDALDILTPSLWNHVEHAEIHFKVWIKEIQNLQIKMFSYYFFARLSVLMHHRHIKQMARPVLYTLFMLCGFMHTLNVVWCIVTSVVLFTLFMLCGV